MVARKLPVPGFFLKARRRNNNAFNGVAVGAMAAL